MRVRSSVALLLLIGLFCGSANADQWFPAEKKKYYSADKKYRLEVIPKKLESPLAYFRDKTEGKDDAGAVKGLKDNRAKAIFSVRNTFGYSKKYEFPLVNEVSPVSALVSNDGKYLVTFDNWHQAGYGDDVVVIYRSDGTLVKKFGLDDLFTENDIRSFRRSVSSIWWGGDHYIDDTKAILYLKVGSKEPYYDLGIELATGRPLEPKRSRSVTIGDSGHVVLGPADVPANPMPGEPVCTTPEAKFDLADAMRVSSVELRSKFNEVAEPRYPPIALAAHAEGTVVVEVLISKTGELICARTLQGHPLLLKSTLLAAQRWQFHPFETTDGFGKVVGTMAVIFKMQ